MSEATHVDVCVPNFQSQLPSGWGQRRPGPEVAGCFRVHTRAKIQVHGHIWPEEGEEQGRGCGGVFCDTLSLTLPPEAQFCRAGLGGGEKQRSGAGEQAFFLDVCHQIPLIAKRCENLS